MKTLVSMGYGPFTGRNVFSKMFGNTVQYYGLSSLARASAVVFWGGTDISPALYGETPNIYNEGPPTPSSRDIEEWEAMQFCRDNNIMMIGVCRGMQLMTAFAGGKLAQDVGSFHLNGHMVTTDVGDSFFTAGNHHQMCLLPESAHLIAHSTQHLTDKYIGEGNETKYLPIGFKEPEAAWFPELHGLGFQWHPEWMDEKMPANLWMYETLDRYMKETV